MQKAPECLFDTENTYSRGRLIHSREHQNIKYFARMFAHIRINRVSHKGHAILFASTTNLFFSSSLACFCMQPKHSYGNRLHTQKPKCQTWMNEFTTMCCVVGIVWWRSVEMRFRRFFLYSLLFQIDAVTNFDIFFYLPLLHCLPIRRLPRGMVQLVGCIKQQENNSHAPFSRVREYIGNHSFIRSVHIYVRLIYTVLQTCFAYMEREWIVMRIEEWERQQSARLLCRAWERFMHRHTYNYIRYKWPLEISRFRRIPVRFKPMQLARHYSHSTTYSFFYFRFSYVKEADVIRSIVLQLIY